VLSVAAAAAEYLDLARRFEPSSQVGGLWCVGPYEAGPEPGLQEVFGFHRRMGCPRGARCGVIHVWRRAIMGMVEVEGEGEGEGEGDACVM
jgi:hypothetical protein